MPPSDATAATDEQLPADAANRLRKLLADLRKNAVDFAGDQEGRALAAAAADAAERMLDHLTETKASIPAHG